MALKGNLARQNIMLMTDSDSNLTSSPELWLAQDQSGLVGLTRKAQSIKNHSPV